jgi:hypothetical protein
VAQNNWYKNNDNAKIWWLDNGDERKGEFIFSFDKNKKYNLFQDYPQNLTPQEKDIFDSENVFWKNYFSDRR